MKYNLVILIVIFLLILTTPFLLRYYKINKIDKFKDNINQIKYYNSNIQLNKKVIIDVLNNIKPESKVLIFGLGWDSKMWYNYHNNTYFVENKDEYINLNKKDIPTENIIKFNYNNINVKNSCKASYDYLNNIKIPEKLKKIKYFDIIIIDGPEGYRDDKPGRLIPFFWSTKLSKKGTIIYADDSSRKLESYCISKFYKSNNKILFPERNGCTKIFV